MLLPLRPITALTILSLLAGCSGFSGSKLNPVNWFGPREKTYTEFSTQRPADPRPLIETIIEARVEPLPSGALVRATGRAATQGYWLADLVVNPVDEAGNLVIDFRVIPAQAGAAISSPRSREITAAVSLRADTLARAKRIIVRGAGNENIRAALNLYHPHVVSLGPQRNLAFAQAQRVITKSLRAPAL
ncbi:MAG: hypothetical protein U5N55_12170 [Cypionkella sp.]|nr:hypothetical protein [Cypionkella sp.]